MSVDYPRNPKDIILEMLIGKEGVRKRQMEAELEHERQLAAIRSQSSTAAQAEQPKPTEKLSRRQFVEPLLDAKGWSILDWANEAGVAHATAQDFMDNKRRPYASTRLKLAKALGVNVDKLPR